MEPGTAGGWFKGKEGKKFMGPGNGKPGKGGGGKKGRGFATGSIGKKLFNRGKLGILNWCWPGPNGINGGCRVLSPFAFGTLGIKKGSCANEGFGFRFPFILFCWFHAKFGAFCELGAGKGGSPWKGSESPGPDPYVGAPAFRCPCGGAVLYCPRLSRKPLGAEVFESVVIGSPADSGGRKPGRAGCPVVMRLYDISFPEPWFLRWPSDLIASFLCHCIFCGFISDCPVRAEETFRRFVA